MIELVKPLSEAEIEQIRDKTEEVLETIGLRVEHPVLRRQCREAGAAVDESAERVRFPRPLLRELLASVPVELCPPQPGRQGRGGWRRGAIRPRHCDRSLDRGLRDAEAPPALPRRRAAAHGHRAEARPDLQHQPDGLPRDRRAGADFEPARVRGARALPEQAHLHLRDERGASRGLAERGPHPGRHG